jgi:hypothetical protein
MGYIDQTYYDEIYKGVPVNGDAFSSLSERASNVIDQVTGFRLKHTPFEDQPQFVQDMVKMATASQIEYMSANGGGMMVHGSGGLSNVNIGSFRYQGGSSGSSLLSPSALGFLNASGLFYTGVSVNDSTYSP